MSNDEDSIRNMAHQLWEAEGRPEGKADEHWKQAIRQVSNASSQPKRSIDLSKAPGPHEPEQPDQT